MTCEVRKYLSLLVVPYAGLSGIAWGVPPQGDLFFHQRLLRFVFTPVIDRYPPGTPSRSGAEEFLHRGMDRRLGRA